MIKNRTRASCAKKKSEEKSPNYEFNKNKNMNPFLDLQQQCVLRDHLERVTKRK